MTVIRIKRSTVQSTVPTLVNGELAINQADMKLFTLNSGNLMKFIDFTSDAEKVASGPIKIELDKKANIIQLNQYGINVASYGASPSASFSTNTTAFQAAYDACPVNGKIVVPPGIYDYGKPSGTKMVIWEAHGATYKGTNGAMSLPGIVESVFDKRILYQKTGTPSDTLAIMDLQNNGNAGGDPNFVSSTFSSYYYSPPGQTNGCWTNTFVMDSYSANGNYPVQNSCLAVVSKQQVFNGTSLFGMNVEAGEYHSQPNPTTNLLGAEIATLAMGSDNNNVRTGLSLPFQKRFNAQPGVVVEFASGLHMNQGPETRVKRGFLIEGDYDYVFKVERANTLQGIFHVAADLGQKALVMNPTQRLAWLNSGGTEIASRGIDSQGTINITGAGISAGGTLPGSATAYIPIVYNGQTYKIALFPTT